MATPVEALPSRSARQKPTSTPATITKRAKCSSFFNQQVLLDDWWLIKADSDSSGKKLGIGGFTMKEGRGIRSFSSAPVVKRHDAVTLKTVDGITIRVHGYLNRSRTLVNGFSGEVCDHFLIGFPYYWEEFTSLSVKEEPADCSASKGDSCSDADKTPAPGEHGTNVLSGHNFDAILSEASIAKKESSPIKRMVFTNDKKLKAEKKRRDSSNVEHVKHIGPLTRSKARLRDH